MTGMEEIDDGDTTWRFDVDFLRSNWTCIFGRGCLGILPEPAEHLGHGCCSMGADLDGDDAARMVGALAATRDPGRFEHHAEAAAGGVYGDEGRLATRVVDGACIFLNRPGFAGGRRTPPPAASGGPGWRRWPWACCGRRRATGPRRTLPRSPRS